MAQRFQSVSLGQGQAPRAKRMIENGAKEVLLHTMCACLYSRVVELTIHVHVLCLCVCVCVCLKLWT